MTDELDPILFDLAEPFEREDLEPARVGQHRPVPGGEPVQPAERLDHLFAGAQMQVVGVAEDDLRAGAANLVRMQTAHRSVGADRHERGRLHDAVGQREAAGAGQAFGGVEGEVEQGYGLWAMGYEL